MRLSLQLTLAAFVLTFTCSAPAQQGTIINATYGAGNRQINVTRRVQSMVQQNGWLNFQNTPQALGVSDPAVGRRRTLNITVLQWNGQTRNYQFQDFAQVNLQLGGGNPTNSVVSARYGYGNARVDVTSRVQSMVQPNGALNFRVSNETLGVRDPAPGRRKDLRIRTTQRNGRTHDYTFQEKSQVAINVGTRNRASQRP